jgi:hypothetical protein
MNFTLFKTDITLNLSWTTVCFSREKNHGHCNYKLEINYKGTSTESLRSSFRNFSDFLFPRNGFSEFWKKICLEIPVILGFIRNNGISFLFYCWQQNSLPFPGKFYFFLQGNFLANGSISWDDAVIVSASPLSRPRLR